MAGFGWPRWDEVFVPDGSLLESFLRGTVVYFALVFLDRRVPRIGRECEGFAFMANIREGLIARVQRCIDEQYFPPTVRPLVALRILWAPVLGIAAMRLSERMAPGEDPDALVHEAINTTIAGLRFCSVAAQ